MIFDAWWRNRSNAQRSVLVVERDRLVRTVVQAILQRNGMRVCAVASADEAHQLCSDSTRRIDLVIIDMRLASKSGAELAVEIRQLRPSIPILFTSGTPIAFCGERAVDAMKKLSEHSYGFLPKPFTADVLMQAFSEWVAVLQAGRAA